MPMSGLFLNFYQVEVSSKHITVDAIDYQPYSSDDKFQILQENFPHYFFYRSDPFIIFWGKTNAPKPEGIKQISIDLTQNPKILSKMLEYGIINYIARINSYEIYRNKYSNVWQVISPTDILKGKIKGLKVNRVVRVNPHFFFREDKLLIGFSLSTSLKNSFTWSKSEFENNGVDIKGLRFDDEKVHANLQSIKRFLESQGLYNNYNQIIGTERLHSTSFSVIDKFYQWLNKNKSQIDIPYALQITSITKRYLPFENELIKSEIINKPQRYFYSNRKNTQGLRFYDQMVGTYQPYSFELYQNKEVRIGVLCPLEYQGETEGFIKKIDALLRNVFHLNSLKFTLKTIAGKELQAYQEALYDNDILQSDLVYTIVNKSQEKLSPHLSPYHVCKAKLIGNGIPTQDIQIETIRQNLEKPTMTNIGLNSYAKLGGTAWTIEKEDRLKDEIVIGIGSSISENGDMVLGIAQVFHNDGRYMTGDCSPLSTFDNYAENLENHLFNILNPIIKDMSQNGTFRLIFHLFKSASAAHEIKAIRNLEKRFSNYNFEFALVHLAYGHNFRLYYNDGKNDINKGTYIQLSEHSALLHFVKASALPLKIDLDKRSTFTSLFYLSKQVYWFSHLSHRSYAPAKRTVTIMYPSLMSKITEELKKVDNWDYDRLKAVSDKLWFI